MRKYSNAVEKIEVEVQNLKGEYKVLTAKTLTANDMQKIVDVSIDDSIKAFDKMKIQMSMFFGGKEEDYNNYDVRILRAVINDLQVDLQNPTPVTQS